MSELNLIPYELKQKRASGLNNKNTVILIILLFTCLILMIALPLVNLFRLSAKELALRSEIKRGEVVLQESEELKRDINSYTQYIKMVQGLTNMKSNAAAAIKKIEGNIPSDLILDNLNYGDGVINISGKSKNKASFYNFAAKLLESGDYKNARINSIAENETEGLYTGTITIEY